MVTFPDPFNPTDADLLRAFARSRDDLAFGRLVARHAGAVRTVALRTTGNLHAAEDVAQATFLVLSGRVGPAARSARRRGSVRPWLVKTCRYCAANWRRSEQRRRRREHIAAVPERVDPSRPGELAEAVAAAMAKLPSRDRRLIELHHLDEQPWPQVAAALKLTPDAAKRAGARAMVRLRRVLGRRGITASSAAVFASLTLFSRGGRAAAAPSSLAFTLARQVLLMLKVQTVAVALAAAGLVTLLGVGVGVAGGFSQDGGESGAAGAVTLRMQPAPAATSRPTAASAQGSGAFEVTFNVDGRDEAPTRVGGLTVAQFTRVHDDKPSPRLDVPLSFDAVPLSDVIVFLRASTGLSIDLHQQALELAGLDVNTPVSFQSKPGVSFENAMRRILGVAGGGYADLRLGWRYGAYVVTTADDLKSIDTTVADQLGELLLDPTQAAKASETGPTRR